MSVRHPGTKAGDVSPETSTARSDPYQNVQTPATIAGRNLAHKVKEPGRSMIDAGMVITGTVTCSGELEVLGQIQGDLHCHGLTVSQPGHIRGDIFSENADINGRVEGTIRAKQVFLRSGAHVTGDIQHASLAVEHGAIFEGEVRRSDNPTEMQPVAPQAPVVQAVSSGPKAELPSLGQDVPLALRLEPVQQTAPDEQVETDPAPWLRQKHFGQ